MLTKFYWKANRQKRRPKTSNAFNFLKLNVSVLANSWTKLNVNVGYVILVISSASMVWFVKKIECKEIERIQKRAWISSSWEVNYKKRLSELKPLPLSYYFEPLA